MDLAFVPVGSPPPNSSPFEAVRIAGPPRKVVPFRGSGEGISELADKIRASGMDVESVTPK